MPIKADRLRFIFAKLRGDNALVKTWEEFDATQQALIVRGLKFDSDEVQVVGIGKDRNLVVITTKRIIWHSTDALQSLKLDAIAEVKVPDFARSNKLDLNRLWLRTREGTEYPLEMESGEPFFVLWNLLIRVIDQLKIATG
jgi:hypothetical protein